MHAKPGDRVVEGQPLLTLHTDEPERFERAEAALAGGIEVAPSEPGTDPRPSYTPTPIVLDRVSA